MAEPRVTTPSMAGTPGEQAVFVYGSLKRDQPNHHWLEGSSCWGQAQLAGVALYDLGPFPMAVAVAPGAGATPLLQGELYGVDGATLARLDRLEGSPRLFQRHWLVLLDGSSAWIYLGRASQVRHSAPISTGRWQGPSQPRWRRPETRLERMR
jgi:gamma-glutamylcyclotransferase (GGCT)/AIG2-like uncharacterized protein YtfP